MSDSDDQGAGSAGTSFSVSVHEEEFDPITPPEMDRDYEDVEVEWDLAIINQRNEELRQRNKVREFFAKVKKIKSVWDDKDAREWLAELPHTMRGEAIPLFESITDGVSEDYQLHPSYSRLPQGVIAQDPDLDFHRLSDTELRAYQNRLFIPLGRLFVNAANGNRLNKRVRGARSRLTRWTGYEVSVADDLGLWIAFDGHSLASPAPLWYPVRCGLTMDLERGIGCLLSSLSKLEHATFENARSSMETTYQPGLMVINEVEKSDVKDIETEAITQAPAYATKLRGPKADVAETPLTLAIQEEDEDWVKRLVEIQADVNHSNRRGYRPITLAVAKSNVAILELLLSTDKVNIDLDTGNHQTLFEYASQIAVSSEPVLVGLPDNICMADFAAGIDERDLPSTTSAHITQLATKYPSFAVLTRLRKHVTEHKLIFNPHRRWFLPDRRGRLRVDPIRKQEPKESKEPEGPRKQQNVHLSARAADTTQGPTRLVLGARETGKLI